jgi:hypothetical protein
MTYLFKGGFIMLNITNEELEIILKALNLAGSLDVTDSTFDDLYDELESRRDN